MCLNLHTYTVQLEKLMVIIFVGVDTNHFLMIHNFSMMNLTLLVLKLTTNFDVTPLIPTFSPMQYPYLSISAHVVVLLV